MMPALIATVKCACADGLYRGDRHHHRGYGQFVLGERCSMCRMVRDNLSEQGSRVSARVKYSGGGGGMGSKAYTISNGSIAYQAPGSSYLHEESLVLHV